MPKEYSSGTIHTAHCPVCGRFMVKGAFDYSRPRVYIGWYCLNKECPDGVKNV